MREEDEVDEVDDVDVVDVVDELSSAEAEKEPEEMKLVTEAAASKVERKTGLPGEVSGDTRWGGEGASLETPRQEEDLHTLAAAIVRRKGRKEWEGKKGGERGRGFGAEGRVEGFQREV